LQQTGFDTASTIGLLSIAAIGRTSQGSITISPASIVTFPVNVLF
jgi:high-affinity nickel permease